MESLPEIQFQRFRDLMYSLDMCVACSTGILNSGNHKVDGTLNHFIDSLCGDCKSAVSTAKGAAFVRSRAIGFGTEIMEFRRDRHRTTLAALLVVHSI